MNLQFYIWILLKYKLQNKVAFGHRIVFKGHYFTHLFFGIYIRTLFSLRFKESYDVEFLNKEGKTVKINVVSLSQVRRYSVYPGYKYTKKRTWTK